MFERGLDIKETLELGKFSAVTKKIREIFEKIMDGSIRGVYWSSFNSPKSEDLIYQVEPKEKIEYKNIPDSGGGNVNKFYVRMTLNDFKNYSAVKNQIKQHFREFEWILKEEDVKIINLNFYLGQKYFKKAGMDYYPDSLLIELNYAKF